MDDRFVRLTATLGAALGLACTEPGPSRGVIGSAESALVSDQVHSSGTHGFFFLPPMVSNPALEGTNLGGLQPTVRIDELGGPTLVTYPAAEVRDQTPAHYHVNWPTRDFALDRAKVYRINVLLGPRTVGFADVQVVDDGAGLRRIDSAEYVGLVDGRTLPIKFFMNVCAPVVCTALDACHLPGTCSVASGGTCSNPVAPDGTGCSDGNACTRSDACSAGSCVGSSPVVCTAADPCHLAGVCDPATGACSNPVAPDGTDCSDGDACTQTDACRGGACAGTNPVVCTAADQCHEAGTCDPASGLCSNPSAPDGLPCDDGSACTRTDTCQTGACTGGDPVLCAASDPCHDIGTCDPASGVCSSPNAPDGRTCDDGDGCTTGDACTNGACAGAPLSCDDGVACTLDSCDAAAGCAHDARPCAPARGCGAGEAGCHEVSVGLASAGGVASASDSYFLNPPSLLDDGAASVTVNGWGNNGGTSSSIMILLERTRAVFRLNVFFGGDNTGGWAAGTSYYLPSQLVVQTSIDPLAAATDPLTSSRWTSVADTDGLTVSHGHTSGTHVFPDFTNASWGTTQTITFDRRDARAVRLVFDGRSVGGSTYIGQIGELDVVAAVIGETCSDGLQNQGETTADCGGPCPVCACGDGVVQARSGEQCDDGNTASGDGCSSVCARESACGPQFVDLGSRIGPAIAGGTTIGMGNDSGGTCGGGSAPDVAFTFTAATGGSYVFDTIGSAFDTVLYVLDGCGGAQLACNDDAVGLASRVSVSLVAGQVVRVMVDGFSTRSGAFVLNAAQPTCGNSSVQPGNGEQCDDGNLTSFDGCSASCQVEAGWTCTAPPSGRSVCGAAACGDGLRAGAEQCDDGNTVAGDGCSPTCRREVCGDGVLQLARGEECDDGNLRTYDGCDASCRIERCGNSRIEGNESCDDGNTAGGDGCSATCHAEYCGDAVVEPLLGEECDDGNWILGDGCDNRCRRDRCGDGIVQPAIGEMCDGSTGCSSSCRFACSDGVDLGSALGIGVASGSTVGSLNLVSGSCGGSQGEDVAFTWTAPAANQYTFDTFGSPLDTVLHVHDASCAGPELACSDDAAGSQRSSVTVALAAGQRVVIAVDGAGRPDAFVLNIAAACPLNVRSTPPPSGPDFPLHVAHYSGTGRISLLDASGALTGALDLGTRTSTTFARGFLTGVAFDAAGNLYTCAEDLSSILIVGPSGSSTFASGLGGCAGLLFDPSDGGLLVAEPNAGRISMVSATGAVSVLAEGLDRPTQLAFDDDGSILVNESGLARLSRVSRSGLVTPVYAPVPSGIGVGVAPDGNIYVTSGFSRTGLLRVDRCGTASIVSDVFTNAAGIAVHRSGAVFVADEGLGRVVSFDPGSGRLATLAAGLRAAFGVSFR